MKKLIQLKLKYWAKLILIKYKPDVIGITGSVGKTSAKEAIYTVLNKEKRVRANKGNYNNEFGLPLTIIGAKSPGRNIFGWIMIGFKVLKMLIIRDKDYPEILILEMGIDRPGDMDYLNSIVKCKIGVATAIGSVHMEYFKNKSDLQKEKAKLIACVKKDGCSIINYDDEETRKMADLSQARIVNYGFLESADIVASELSFANEGTEIVQGIRFKVSYKNKDTFIYIPRALGKGMVYSALAGVAAGLSYGMDLNEIAKSLKEYKSPRGRLNIIAGIKNTTIIDDSYNCEPKSAILAIDTLSKINTQSSQKKILALGDMLELGADSEDKHREIGKLIADSNINKLYAIGEKARDIARGAKEAGMIEDDVFMFDYSSEAGAFIQKRIKKGDYILVKGSQGARMEKIVLELMNDPLRAKELLVRQGKEWEQK